MAFTIITGGSYTSAGTAVQIPMPSSPDYFVTENVTQIVTTSTQGCAVRGEWYGLKYGAGATAVNDGIRWKKADSSSAISIDSFSTSTTGGGFTYVATVPVVEAQNANAITAITNASPAVVSQTNSYSAGDVLQFYGTTGMLQIAGMNFQISSVSGSTYTLLGLPAAGFAAAATAGFTRRISKYAAVDPQFLYVTAVSQATQAVVTTSVNPGNYYVVGMKVHFSIPYSFGMYQLNELTGTILAINQATYQMTIDINTSAFTAFAFPDSTASPGATLFATLAPAGASTQYNPITGVQTGYNFLYQAFQTGIFTPYMNVAGGKYAPGGASGDIINWMAYKLEN